MASWVGTPPGQVSGTPGWGVSGISAGEEGLT